jgi:hypothetical protein
VSKRKKISATADEPAPYAVDAERKDAAASVDGEDLAARCMELEKLLAATNVLGQQIELHRNFMVQGADKALRLLNLIASGQGTIDDHTAGFLAIGRWLHETATSDVSPLPWALPEPTVKH